MSTADPNRVILTGENPFIRLSAKDGDHSTNASYWRILFSRPARVTCSTSRAS